MVASAVAVTKRKNVQTKVINMNEHELIVGAVYFSLSFHDRDLLIPDIKTCIYIGKDIIKGENDSAGFFFQGAEAYLEKGIWKSGLDAFEYDLFFVEADILESIVDYSGLQQQIEYMKKGGAKYYP